MTLDIQTLVFVLGVTHLIQVAVLLQQYRTRAFRGVGWWLLWSLSATFGFSFNLLRQIPSIQSVSIILQNTLILIGAVFLYIGILRFTGKKENIRIILFALFSYVAGFAFFVYVNDNIHLRGIIASVALATVSFITALTLFSNRSQTIRSSTGFLTIILIVHGGVFASRAVMIGGGIRIEDVFQPTMFNYLPYLDGIIVGLLWTFGLIMMVNERLSAEMSEATKKFEHIFTTGPEAALISTIDGGTLLTVNASFTTLTGYTTKEVVGQSTLGIKLWVNPSDRDSVINEIRIHGKCDNLGAEFQRNNGSRFFGLLSASKVTIDGVPCLLSVIRDISARKSVEVALKESEEKFSRAFQTSPYAITITRAENGAFIDVNDAFTAITGYQREEALADSSIGLQLWVDGEDRQKVVEDLQSGKTVHGREFLFRAKSGNVITGLFSAQVIKLSRGTCILSSINDITGSKRAQQVLRENEQRLSFHMENSPMAIIEWNSTFMVTRWSGEAVKIFGWKPEEVLGKAIMDLQMIYEEDIPVVENVMLQLTSGTSKYVVSYNRNYTKYGKVIFCEWYNSILLNPEGETVSVMSQVLDITARKQAEEQIKNQLSELQRWQNIMLDREDRVRELKSEVNKLCDRLGESNRYSKEVTHSLNASAERYPA